jgi:sugar lactone lactonase YvrE
MTPSSARALAPLFAAALAALPAPARAAGTRVWELAGFDELDKGEARDTRISSRGEVTLGSRAVKVEIGEVGLVWSAAADAAGTIYLGTGYDGKIFRIDGGKAVAIAKTGQLVITALALDAKGDLYAASLPDAVIWKIAKPAEQGVGEPFAAVKWATFPEEAKHVWALAFDAAGKTLYAGTGPNGQIYAVGADGKPQLYLDTEEEHVLALVAAASGRLLAGTSPGALVLEVTGPGRATARADFDATEVRALALRGDTIVAAVNKFSSPPPLPSKPASPPPGVAPPPQTGRAARLGDGAVVFLHASGQEERVFERAKAHVNALAVDAAGTVYAGLAADGKIVSIDPGRVTQTVLDLEERQVLCLLARERLALAGTADAGAVYAVEAPRPAEAMYFTPALDAESKARFGLLRWFGDGTLSVKARCGNTLTPDKSWSDWSADVANGGRVPCGPSRYLQLRFSWKADPKASLRAVELTYQQANLRAAITELNPDSPFFGAGKGKPGGDGGPQPSARTIAAKPAAKNPMKLELTWKTDNPDGDDLRFRLYYRAVGERLWRPILRDDEVLTKPKYTWETETVPEGRYEVRLVADDSPANDPRDVLADERISVPVLIDNHQPAVVGLAVAKGEVRGKAVDGFSAIAALEMSIDGEPWWPLRSDDGMFDEVEEAFAIPLPAELPPGPHAVAVRAYDRAGNSGTAEIHFETK